jgi:hypothetical protein
MSVARQANLLGQQRLDIPHLRAVESSVAADFDLLAGQIMAGKRPLVISGFELAIEVAGTAATSLQLLVAGSVIMHPEASESGTIFQVPLARADETLNASNTRVRGSFTASAVNYIGIDLRRTADASTADLVQFLDADTSLENPKTVPLGRTLDYIIVISTQDFSTTPGIAPIAKVTTDAANNIATDGIEDARNIMFRLGTGGAITDWKNQFSWPGGRGEPGSDGNAPNSDFISGDKSITSLKEWMDGVMSRVWEIGGGEYWYSATADRNVKLFRAGATFTNGDWFEWDGTDLHWKGLTVVFDNSTGVYNDVENQTINSSGLTNLADGECLYVDLDRTQDRVRGVNGLVAVKAQLATLGTPVTPGARLVLAWRRGSGTQAICTRDAQFPVNATFVVATPVSTGVVKLNVASPTPTSPVVAVTSAAGEVLATGLQASAPATTLLIGTTASASGVSIGAGVAAAIDIDALTSVGVQAGGGVSIASTASLVTVSGLSTALGYNTAANIIRDNTSNAASAGRYVVEFDAFNGATYDHLLGVSNKGPLDMIEVSSAYTPITPSSGRAKLYFTNNGAPSPGKRQRLTIMWDDGTTTVVAESPAH